VPKRVQGEQGSPVPTTRSRSPLELEPDSLQFQEGEWRSEETRNGERIEPK